MHVGLTNAPDMSLGKRNISKIFHIQEAPKEGSILSPIKNGQKVLTPESAKKKIKFNGVWFKYPSPNSKWVLRNFNLTIRGGESLGIKGESGSGKSTLIQLLLRFYDPQYGFISIGGTPLKEFTISSVRACFGLVQQEPIIFDCSIMDNILYGKQHASAQEIERAANLANATEFIKRADDEHIEQVNSEDDPRYSRLHQGFQMK